MIFFFEEWSESNPFEVNVVTNIPQHQCFGNQNDENLNRKAAFQFAVGEIFGLQFYRKKLRDHHLDASQELKETMKRRLMPSCQLDVNTNANASMRQWVRKRRRAGFLSFSSFLPPLPLPLSSAPLQLLERRPTCSLGLGLPLGKQKKARNQSELEEGSDSNHNRYRSSYHCVAREKLHLAI